MMQRGIALTCLAALGCLFGPAAAQARYYGHHHRNLSGASRQRMIQAAQAQLGMARKVAALAQVQMAQAQTKVDASTSRIRDARVSMTTAKSDEKTAHNSLQEIFGRLLEQSGPQSEIGKAHAALVDADEQLEAAGKRVVESEAYQTKVGQISAIEDRLHQLPKVRAALFEDDAPYQVALARYKQAKVTYGRLRTELVRHSPEWMAMSQEVRDAWKDQNKAEVEATNGGFSHMSAWYKLHDAKQVYTAAQMAIAQAENTLRRLGVKPPPPPPPMKSALDK